MPTLSIAKRFCGPPSSANGGYFCGTVAALSAETLTVRMLKPPPLDTDLEAAVLEDGGITVRHGDVLIAQARVGTLDVTPPEPPSYVEALDASTKYVGFHEHPFPTCFVCGTQRERGDGLRVFAGRVPDRAPDQQIVAAPWVPDRSLDQGDGKVRPEYMWAVMDCPGCYAANKPIRGNWLLGEFTAHVDRLVHIDEPCIIVGWRIASSGRKHEAGTALFDEDGELIGRAKAIWIEPAAQD